MFEERFGRKATTVLLAVIGLGVFGFCAHLAWDHLVAPLYELLIKVIGDEWFSGYFMPHILPIAITTGIVTTVAVIVFMAVQIVLHRRRVSLFASVRKESAKVRERTELLLKAMTDFEERATQILNVANKLGKGKEDHKT